MNFKNWFQPFSPPPKKSLLVPRDVFADGQVRSKIWLCEELERVLLEKKVDDRALKVAVLAGWCGLLPFLLFSRGKIPLEKIDLFDLDAQALQNALAINQHWALQQKFLTHLQDVNRWQPQALFNDTDLWINTSCEHFDDQTWWSSIPAGRRVLLQGTDMPHHEHVRPFRSLEDFVNAFEPWGQIDFQGQLDFDYGSFAFSRFMVIGRKHS